MPSTWDDSTPGRRGRTPAATAETTAAETTVDPAGWVAAYRSAYPALAEGRSDDGIANNGDRACDYLASRA